MEYLKKNLGYVILAVLGVLLFGAGTQAPVNVLAFSTTLGVIAVVVAIFISTSSAGIDAWLISLGFGSFLICSYAMGNWVRTADWGLVILGLAGMFTSAVVGWFGVLIAKENS